MAPDIRAAVLTLPPELTSRACSWPLALDHGDLTQHDVLVDDSRSSWAGAGTARTRAGPARAVLV